MKPLRLLLSGVFLGIGLAIGVYMVKDVREIATRHFSNPPTISKRTHDIYSLVPRSYPTNFFDYFGR